ncbi:protein kinase domain-containing protein [Deinococcus sp. UYEF24]
MTLTRFVDSKGQLVAIGKELGVGGQGAVHLVDGRPDEVAKVYLKPPSHTDIRKLEAQVQACRPDILSISAWPSALLKNSAGSVQGLIMPLVDLAEYTEIHNLFGPASRRKYFPKADWAFLIHVARNVARAFAVIHDGGHVVGDVSSRNMLVSQQGKLKLIDTDSFQVRSGQTVFPCPVGTAESTPPELQGQTFGTFLRSTNHDLFGMAVIIFQLLFQGRHPYSGIHADGTTPNPAEAIKGNRFAYAQSPRGVRPPPQTLLLSDLPSEVATLFERTFAPSAHSRPTAKEWDQGLATLSQALVTCQQDPGHKHVRGKRCPWCAMNQGATAKGGFAPGAKRLDVKKELNLIWQGVQAIPKPMVPQAVPAPMKVAPLALPWPMPPMLAIVPISRQKLQAARTRRTVATLLFVVLAVLIWRGSSLPIELGLGLVAWILFANSNSKRIKAAHLKTQEAEHQALIQQYEGKKQEVRVLLERQSEQAQTKLNALYSRQRDDSAFRKYQLALKALEDQRAAVLALAAEEGALLQQVREKYRQTALEQYLRRQVLAPGQVNGIGPGLIANLQQKGVRTAYDVTEQVRWIAGIGPRRAGDLMLWRRTQESFFNFDPASIPPGEFAAAIAAHDQKVLSRLQLLGAEVGKLPLQMTTWKVLDQVVVNDIQAQLIEVEQCKLSFRQLEELWP